ncbi:MAG: TIGR03435 family protein [Acidobacteriaceae bacterium]
MLHAAMWVVVAAPIALAQTSAPVKSNATVAATPAAAPTTSVSPATTAAGPVAATPAADPTLGITFDVVSIKPVKADPSVYLPERLSNPPDGDGITLENYSLFDIIRWNHNNSMFFDDQIVDAPKWFLTDRYTIQAKVADSDVAAWHKLNDAARRLVFRKMLVERFKFTYHFADVEQPVYNLVVAKDGLKIKEAKPGEASPYNFKTSDGSLNPDGTRVAYAGAGVTQRAAPDGYPMSVFQQSHFSSFAKDFLSNRVGRHVIDKTGLTGPYNFTLEFAPEQGAGISTADDTGPVRASIFTAVQEQLGLKLESATGPVSHLYIDHIERPSEN